MPSLPAPKIAGASAPERTDAAAPSGLLQKMLNGQELKLTVAQLQKYLAENGRNAESLITASRLTGDLSLLREAAQRFPQDPRVQFEMAMRSEDPAEKQRAVEAFAELDTDNALASYLAAVQAFDLGDSDGAVKRLMEAAQRPEFRDYMMANVQASEDALKSVGQPEVEAKAAAMFGAPLPFISRLNELGRKMSDLARSYVESGDTNSAAIISGMGQTMGEQLQHAPGRTLIHELVGEGVETRFLRGLDPSAVLLDSGLTVQQRLDQLAERKDLIKTLTRTVDPTSLISNPVLLNQYLDRTKAMGEAAALEWLRDRIGQKPQP